MADPFRKVRPNEEITFSAAAENAKLDAARAFRLSQHDIRPGVPLTQTRSGDIVPVLNDTGSDLPVRAVVGLDGPIFEPGDSLEAFLREVAFRGVTPTADHGGKFGILLAPAAADQVVRAYVAGVTQVLVDVADPDHSCADVDPGSTLNLVTKEEGGSAQLLWIDPSAYYEGLRWAIVRFGSTCGGSESGGTGGGLSRCDCPEDSYEVEVDCGSCGEYYGTIKMPRFWRLTILGSQEWPYGTPCIATPCLALVGKQFLLEIEDDAYGSPTCTWSGAGPGCITAELTPDGDDEWKITILDPDDCVMAVLRVAGSDFQCCGTTDAWESDPGSACDISATLAPHECTCCPDLTPCLCGCLDPGPPCIGWQVSFEFGPPGGMFPCPCHFVNGSYLMRRDTPDGCTYRANTGGGGFVELAFNAPGDKWLLTISDNACLSWVGELSRAAFDCGGSNVFPKVSSNNTCSTEPASITVSPVGPHSCD